MEAEKNKRISWVRLPKFKQCLMSNYFNVNRYLTDEIDPREKTIIFERIEREVSSVRHLNEASIEDNSDNTITTFNSIEQSQQLANLRVNLQSKQLE